MTKANVKTAKATKKSNKVEVKMSKADIKFKASVEKIMTGNKVVDQIATKVLYAIRNGEVKMKEVEGGFEGQLGEAMISSYKQTKGEKGVETVLDVGGFSQFNGPISARAYKLAFQSLNKKGRATKEVDEDQANSVLELLF